MHTFFIAYTTIHNTRISAPGVSNFLRVVCRISYVLTPILAMVYDHRFRLKIPFYKRIEKSETDLDDSNNNQNNTRQKFYFNINN